MSTQRRNGMVDQAVEQMMAGPAGAAVGAHLSHAATQTELLQQLLAQLETDPLQLAVTDKAVLPGIQINFPVPGARRAVIRRQSQAPAVTSVGTAGALLFDSNDNRIGGTLVNKGTAGVTVYLGDRAGTGFGSIWLGPGGGAWDFRVGNVLWCGAIFAVADSTTQALAGLEL